MDKNDKSLLDLETKIGKYNEKEQTLKNLRINKPNMNINLLKNKNFDKENLLSFLDKFKKENEKILKEENNEKYNIENEQEDNNDDNEEGDNKNEIINLDEDKEKCDEKIEKNKKKKGQKIEIDLLMGILEQQKKKEISIEDIIINKKIEKNDNDDNIDIENNNFLQKDDNEIIDFLIKNEE